MKRNSANAFTTYLSKKTFFATILLCSQLASAGANKIDIMMNASDLSRYDKTKEHYQFSQDASLIANNGKALNISEMQTRGQGSLSAKRKNLGIKLPEAIQVGSVRGKDVNLISMWVDKGYISTRLGFLTANLLEIGQAQQSEYVEVTVNNKSNGLYIIVEKPAKVVKKSPFVVRRRGFSKIDVKSIHVNSKLAGTEALDKNKDAILIKEKEAKFAKGFLDRLSGGYAQIRNLNGQALWSFLEANMDIKAYMRLIILNSLYTNGDGADEVFFYVDPDKYEANGKIYFRVLPWDSDDLFKAMHQQSTEGSTNNRYFKALQNSLIYNFEDHLDRKFAHDAFLYSQLQAEALVLLQPGGLLDEAHTDQLLNQLRSELNPYISNPDILEKSADDGITKGQAYTVSAIDAVVKDRRAKINERRKILIKRAQLGFIDPGFSPIFK